MMVPILHAATQSNPVNWGLDRIDQRFGLDNEYTYISDGSGVYVYILDVPMQTNHTEYASRFIKQILNPNMPSCPANGGIGGTCGRDTTCAEDNDLISPASHGTHVGGIAVGSTYGVAKNAFVVSVQALQDCGQRALGNKDTVVWAIQNAILDRQSRGNPDAVINLSLSSPGNAEIDTAIQDALDAGISVVVSAGNNDQDVCNSSSPQKMGGPNSDAIGVGASDENDYRWEEPGGVGSNFGTCVDIFAPGTHITSSVFGTPNSDTTSGTSQAAPFVTGRVAQYLQAHPGTSPTDVKAALTTYAATHKIIRFPGSQEVGNLIYTGDSYDTAMITSEFTGCNYSNAHYIVDWDGNYGPYSELYTVEAKIGAAGSWFPLAQQTQSVAWGLDVPSQAQYKTRVVYTANGISSPMNTTPWHTAPSCGGSGGGNNTF